MRLFGQLLFLALLSFGGNAAMSFPATLPVGPVHDPGRVLSQEVADKIGQAARAFQDLTGRGMVVVVLPRGRVPEYSGTVGEGPNPALGILYATSPEDAVGQLLIVDAAWRKALPAQWTYMFPQRLAQKFGDEPFERRVVLSARYLATVFPDKLAFVLKPRGGRLSEGSLKFSRGAYIGIEILGYFIIFLTVFRTFWPARLRDEDQDDFSNELRRLKKERQIW